jgi:hypothetical protein
MAANGFIGDFIMGRFYVLELLYQVECIGWRGKITIILDLLMYVIFSPDKCLLDLYCI